MKILQAKCQIKLVIKTLFIYFFFHILTRNLTQQYLDLLFWIEGLNVNIFNFIATYKKK